MTGFTCTGSPGEAGALDVVVVPDIYFVRDSESERELVAATDLTGARDGCRVTRVSSVVVTTSA